MLRSVHYSWYLAPLTLCGTTSTPALPLSTLLGNHHLDGPSRCNRPPPSRPVAGAQVERHACPAFQLPVAGRFFEGGCSYRKAHGVHAFATVPDRQLRRGRQKAWRDTQLQSKHEYVGYGTVRRMMPGTLHRPSGSASGGTRGSCCQGCLPSSSLAHRPCRLNPAVGVRCLAMGPTLATVLLVHDAATVAMQHCHLLQRCPCKLATRSLGGTEPSASF